MTGVVAPEADPAVLSPATAGADAAPPAPAGRPTVDDMGEWSFPASDPPATWTWEPRRGASG